MWQIKGQHGRGGVKTQSQDVHLSHSQIQPIGCIQFMAVSSVISDCDIAKEFYRTIFPNTQTVIAQCIPKAARAAKWISLVILAQPTVGLEALMAQTQLIPEAAKSTILFKLRPYDASTLATAALFPPTYFTLTVCICSTLFYFPLSVSWACSLNGTVAKINSSQVFIFLRCVRPFPHLIFVFFP